MARTSRSATKKSARKAASPSQKRAQNNRARAQEAPRESLLDEGARRQIEGVVCAVVAVALFVIACMPQDGMLTGLLSQAVHVGLGLGAYLLPFVLALVAVSLFAGRSNGRMSVRVTVGLLLLFLAVLVLLGLYTPGVTEQNLTALFDQQSMRAQGGYVGALIAYVLMLLLGRTVSTVIAVGLVLIALIVIGLNLNGAVDALRAMREERAAAEEDKDALPAPAYEPRRRSRSASDGQARVPLTQKLPFAGDAARRSQPLPDEEPTERLAKRPSVRTARTARAASAPLASEGATQQLTRKLGDRHAKQVRDANERKRATARRPRAGSAPSPTENFELPSMDLLEYSKDAGDKRETEKNLRETAALLQETLSDFGVDASVEGWAAGPTVTLFKVALPAGVRVSRVTGLTDDIALAMASQGVRIFSPVPGTNYVGIEVPNINRRTVFLGDVLKSAPAGPLQVAIGEDVEGHPIVNDLASMPHLLVAGTTGSGKSVAINGMIMSILMRATPDEVRFIMIDPKRVEFTPYNGIPHLYVPVVTETKEAASALAWAVAEMERRLKVFSKVGARNIAQYNDKVHQGMKIGDEPAEQVPYIVIVIDELADLMMNVGKEVEFSISRLAQLARAAGIHMIIATQRPSTNVVTGLIKANITNRMALTVASGIDSRVIIDTTGAENLIGNGDMLYAKPEYPKPQRLQGCFTSNKEIEAVVEHLKEQGEPEYHEEILKTNVMSLGDTSPDGNGARGSSGDDPLLWDAAEIVVNSGLGSTSNIQRRLKVGYSRAGRIMDMLEEHGIVGPPNGSKPREVLVSDPMELETLKAFEQNDQAGE